MDPGLGPVNADDEFDPALFVAPASWRQITLNSRPVIVGRKGTGKTALRRFLSESRRDLVVREDDVESASSQHRCTRSLSLGDFPWKLHSETSDPDMGARTRFREAWSFLCLMQLASLRISDKASPLPTTRAARASARLQTFAHINWGTLDVNINDMLKPRRFKLARFTVKGKLPLTAEAEGSWESVERSNLGPRLGQQNAWLKTTITDLFDGSSGEYYVIFDNIDLDFVAMSADFADSMIGLLMAAQDFQRWAAAANLDVLCIVLMRQDIFDKLRFADKNKLVERRIEQLRWNVAAAGAGSLKSLIERRIEIFLGLRDSGTPFNFWDILFDGNNGPRGYSSLYAYMVDRTMLRPRDMLKLTNLAIAAARRCGRLLDGSPVQIEDVLAARFPYGEWLQRELDDEIHPHWPEWNVHAQRLRHLPSSQFNISQFASLGSNARVAALDTLHQLYDFGLVGMRPRVALAKAQAAGLLSGMFWAFTHPDVPFSERAPGYVVHPAWADLIDLPMEMT